MKEKSKTERIAKTKEEKHVHIIKTLTQEIHMYSTCIIRKQRRINNEK